MNLLLEVLLGLASEEVKRKRDFQNRELAILETENKLNEARRARDDASEVEFLLELASLRAKSSEFEMADTLYKQAVNLAHYLQNKSLEMSILIKHGRFNKARMNYIQAESCYQQALGFAHELQRTDVERKVAQDLIELRNMKQIDDLTRSLD